MERIFGYEISAAKLAKKTRMHNPGSNGVGTSRNSALRRSDHEPSAENFRGAFAVQFNRKKKSHFNRSSGIECSFGTNQQTRNADIFCQSLMPLAFPTNPKPDGGANFVALSSGDFWVRRAKGPIRIHPLSLPSFRCIPGASPPSRLAKFRLGQFHGDSNGPTVLSSYDCIVLLLWNHGVLPETLTAEDAHLVVRQSSSAFPLGRRNRSQPVDSRYEATAAVSR
jgi:hypothetical protein